MSAARQRFVADVYRRLDRAYAGRTWHWDPAHVSGPMDVVVGAILVQHTSWTNAERALESLRAATNLDPAAIARLSPDALAGLIRVSGTPAVKARRLHALCATILDNSGAEALVALALDDVRDRLLATHGVGPETADAIALYAGGHRAFVIDAYTRRLFRRLGHGPSHDAYGDWRAWFEDALAGETANVFQRYHAWIVLHSKQRCRARPLCDGCPLSTICAAAPLTPRAAAAPPARTTAGRSAR